MTSPLARYDYWNRNRRGLMNTPLSAFESNITPIGSSLSKARLLEADGVLRAREAGMGPREQINKRG